MTARNVPANMTRLHDKIRLARQKAGLMQMQLAQAIGVNPSLVSHWETGRRKPSRDLLARVAAVTMLDAAELLEIDQPPLVRLRTEIAVDGETTTEDLTKDEKRVIAFWRALNGRQRKNFLKLLRVSVGVRRKIERQR